MALTSLLYISRSCIDPSTAAVAVHGIVAAAMDHNTRQNLTGALLFTGTHFAQVIEGSSKDIDELFVSISRDARHDHVIVVDRVRIEERRFANWSMAYFGPSQFVARHVTRLLNNPSPSEQHRAAGWLTDLLQEFAAL